MAAFKEELATRVGIGTKSLHPHCFSRARQVGMPRTESKPMPLTATFDPGHHHFAVDNIYFYMIDGDRHVRCGVTRLALEVLEPELPPTKQGRIQTFNEHRSRIDRVTSAKYDRGQLEPDGRTVLVRAADLA